MSQAYPIAGLSLSEKRWLLLLLPVGLLQLNIKQNLDYRVYYRKWWGPTNTWALPP